MSTILRRSRSLTSNGVRRYCEPCKCHTVHRCKLLVVGGGTGGCSVAWRFARKLQKEHIIVLEPSQRHYYQPLFTLVAAGLKPFANSHRPIRSVLPSNVCLIGDYAQAFDPDKCCVVTGSGDKINYEYMVVAMGLENNYDQIPGLHDYLECPKSGVSTIYAPEYCAKTWCCIQNFKGGHAIFTFPAAGEKCSGAAQKIMFLAHNYWKKKKLRQQTNITYNTGGEAMFGVPKYANALTKVARDKCITVNFGAQLVEIGCQGAVFEIGQERERMTLPYSLLHVTPPMCSPQCLRSCPALVDEAGYLSLDQYSLQHTHYDNIYGLGDCTNTPNGKTAAAAAVQSFVVEQNLLATMVGKPASARYDGYGCCALLTSYGRGILAEYGYERKPLETFPFDQSAESRMVYYLKKDYFPRLYWNKVIKGTWNGPARLRKVINPMAW